MWSTVSDVAHEGMSATIPVSRGGRNVDSHVILLCPIDLEIGEESVVEPCQDGHLVRVDVHFS